MASKETTIISIVAERHETASAAVAYVEKGYADKAMWVGAEFITLSSAEAERLVSMEIVGYFINRKTGTLNEVDFTLFNPTGRVPEFNHVIALGSKDGE